MGLEEILAQHPPPTPDPERIHPDGLALTLAGIGGLWSAYQLGRKSTDPFARLIAGTAPLIAGLANRSLGVVGETETERLFYATLGVAAAEITAYFAGVISRRKAYESER